MKQVWIYTAIIILSFSFVSCKDSFEPYTDLEKGYLLYCVLDNRTNSQVVLLQQIHSPHTDKKMPKNTRVILSENGGTNFYLKDTLIAGFDDYSCYYIPSDKLQRGTSYKVIIHEDSLDMQYGEVTYCCNPELTINNRTSYCTLEFTKGVTDYYTFQMYLEYETSKQGINKIHTTKVPVQLIDLVNNEVNNSCWSYFDKSSIQPSYPGDYIYRNNDIPVGGRTNNNKLAFMYSSGCFHYLFKFELSEIDTLTAVTIKRLFVVYDSFDKNIYEKETALSHVSYSLRLGEAVYWTNIRNKLGSGYGFIGSVASDTLFTTMDSTIIKKYGFIDGQKY